MFFDVVDFYRNVGKPAISNESTYSFEGPVTPEILNKIEQYQNIEQKYGEIDVHFKDSAKAIFDVMLPRGDTGRFYGDTSKFLVEAEGIARGNLPDNYYLVAEDYAAGEPNKPTKLIALEQLANFVKLLHNFAEDSSILIDGGSPRLLFVLPPDGKVPQRTVVVPVLLEPIALVNELKHLVVLEALLNTQNDKKLHIEERKLVMKIAIGDVLAAGDENANLFTYLVKNWHEVLKKYLHNLKAYVHRFSFDDVRKKIADAEMEYVSKLSGVLSDISGKLIALPISLVALIALEKAESNFAFWCGFLGLSIVTLVYLLMLKNQKLQVHRLEKSFNLIFSEFFNKIETYPLILRSVLTEVKRDFEVQLKCLRTTFKVFYVISSVPLLGVFYQAGSRYSPELIRFLRYISG